MAQPTAVALSASQLGSGYVQFDGASPACPAKGERATASPKMSDFMRSFPTSCRPAAPTRRRSVDGSMRRCRCRMLRIEIRHRQELR